MAKIIFNFVSAFLVLQLVSTGFGIEVEDCGGVKTMVTLINEAGQECTSLPCDLVQGSVNSIQVDFIAPTDSEKLTAQAFGTIGGLNLPWPGFDRDACKDKGIVCPVKLNQGLSYKLKFEIKKVYPKISTKALFKLFADGKKEVFCFKLPVKIVAPPSKH